MRNVFLFLALTVLVSGCSLLPDADSDTNYTVAGRIVDLQGNGVSGVTVSAQGEGGGTVTTGANGTWQFTRLNGSITISAAGEGSIFEPAQRRVTRATQNVNFTRFTPIMGSAVVTRDQAKRWINTTPTPSEFRDLVDLYYDIAPIYNIRPDMALAQAAHETGYFRFRGDAKPWQNNFAGIGVTGVASDGNTPLNGANPNRVRFEKGVHGAIFVDKATGVEAQIQHLYAYASSSSLPAGRDLLSPRFTLVRRGTAPYVEYLGRNQNPAGVGWATDATYGFKIVNMIDTMLSHK